MYNMLECSVLCGLAASAVVGVIQLTDFLSHAANVCGRAISLMTGRPVKHDFESAHDFIMWLQVASPVTAELLVCPFCLGTWVSLFFVSLLAAAGAIGVLQISVVWPAALAVCAGIRVAIYDN